MKRIYLDWNATAPPHADVVAAMTSTLTEAWGNPASVHGDGRLARSRVEDARARVAALTGIDPRDVLLTGGGTEANNVALRSAFGAFGALITSPLEHPSVLRVAEALQEEGKARVRLLRVLPEGVVDVDDLRQALQDGDVRLVAVQHVNHETGVVQPITEVRRLCAEREVWLHVDAVQAFGRVRDEGMACGPRETRSLAAHKIRGPKGIGALLSRQNVKLFPVLRGGAQERGIRPGTVDPVAAAGLSVAAERALGSPERYRELSSLRDALEAGLLALDAGARVNGEGRAPHVTNIAFSRWSGPELVAAFDLEGISVSSGSACSAGTMEPSPVIEAMYDRDRAGRSVRFSLGETTTSADIETTLTAAARIFSRIVTSCDESRIIPRSGY